MGVLCSIPQKRKDTRKATLGSASTFSNSKKSAAKSAKEHKASPTGVIKKSTNANDRNSKKEELPVASKEESSASNKKRKTSAVESGLEATVPGVKFTSDHVSFTAAAAEERKTEQRNEPKYKLITAIGSKTGAYADELIRLTLHYAVVAYEEERLTAAEWAVRRGDDEDGLKLPVLLCGDAPGDVISGSVPIARYIAEVHDVISDEEWEAALADMLIDYFIEMRQIVLAVIYPLNGTFSESDMQQLKVAKLDQRLHVLEDILRQNGSGWFVGRQVCWADLAVSDFLATIQRKYYAELLSGFDALIRHIETIRSIPDISDYILTRDGISVDDSAKDVEQKHA